GGLDGTGELRFLMPTRGLSERCSWLRACPATRGRPATNRSSTHDGFPQIHPHSAPGLLLECVFDYTEGAASGRRCSSVSSVVAHLGGEGVSWVGWSPTVTASRAGVCGRGMS